LLTATTATTATSTSSKTHASPLPSWSSISRWRKRPQITQIHL
jgi:hypothetical protein